MSMYAPVEIKLRENAFSSFNEYEQQRRIVIQSYKESAPKVDRREEILLQFIVDAIASASQLLFNKLGREFEQSVSQHKETLETERRKATEMRMGLERDRDIAKANLDSMSSNLADAKSREESARKSVEHLEASLRSEKEEFRQRQKELETSNKDMQVGIGRCCCFAPLCAAVVDVVWPFDSSVGFRTCCRNKNHLARERKGEVQRAQ